MDVTFHADPSAFLAAAGDHLAADPVLNTVVATAAERDARHRAAGIVPPTGRPYWFAVTGDATGAIVGITMRTAPFSPYPLFVLPMPDEAAVDMAARLHARGEEVRGVNGALPAARIIAAKLAEPTGHGVAVAQHTRLFELRELIPPRRTPGRLRQATETDLDLATAWLGAFHVDADEQGGHDPAPHLREAAPGPDDVRRQIDEGRLWFWEDGAGERVHLTGANPPAFGVARIGPVYTPRAQRSRGYAGAAVAEVSRKILAAGARPCLFTDQANPTSNAIYEALGFRPVVDMANLVIV